MTTEKGYRAVLQNKSFKYLWLGQIFSQLGDRVCFVVFVAIIVANISKATVYQSWLYVAFTIPAILLTAIAGVFIDRWSKKGTLITTNFLRAGLIMLLPILDHSLLGIYAVAFLVSSVTQFFVPTEAACIPMLVPKTQLLAANSLFTTTMMMALILGFVIGDPLISIFGLDQVHIAISLLFGISALILFGIKEKEPETHEDHSIKKFISELKEGFLYIKNTPIVLNAMLKLATLFSIIVALCILAISISTQLLFVDNPVLGAQKFVYIVAFTGIGMVIGALIVGKFLRHKPKYLLIFWGFTIIGLSLVFLAFISFIPNDIKFLIPFKFNFFRWNFHNFIITLRMIYTFLLASVTGLGCAYVAIPVQTILQSAIPENMRGKVFGVQFTLLSTASTFPVLLAAFGADFIGVEKMVFIAGVPILVFGALGLYRLRKKLKLLV